MSEPLKSAVRAAVLRLLDPLVKLLLEAGVGVGDFLKLVKVAYVRAAREQGQQSHDELTRPNASRIAIVTGLTRGEVATILAAGDAELPASDRGRQRAERVLSGWWNDPEFQQESGAPAVLPIRGARGSFAALVRRYSGERWRSARILEELLRVKAVRRLPDGAVRALSRTYATVRWDPDGIAAVGDQLSEHGATLLHNLKYPSRPRYVRRVLNAQLDPRYLPMLVRDLEQQSDALADSIDDAINDPQYTLTLKRGGPSPVSLGVALYVFEAPVNDDERTEYRRRFRADQAAREASSRARHRHNARKPLTKPSARR